MRIRFILDLQWVGFEFILRLFDFSYLLSDGLDDELVDRRAQVPRLGVFYFL